MFKKGKKLKNYFFINFIIIVSVLYWFMAFFGKKRGQEVFPFFHWSLYSHTHVNEKTVYLDIISIDEKVIDPPISFYEYTKHKIDFRQAEFLLEKMTDSVISDSISLSRILKFLPEKSKSELYELNSNKQKKSLQYIIKPNN